MSIGTRGIHAAQFDIPSLLQNKANTRLCLSPEKKKRGGRGGTTVFISKGRQQKQNHEQTIFLNTSDTIHPHENKKNNHQVIKFVADSNKIFCKN